MATEAQTEKRSKLPLIALVVLVIIIGVVWYGNRSDSKSDSKLHSTGEAVKSVTKLYDYYLPLKAQTVTENGDRQDVEPAAVKVARGSESYFTTKLYGGILANYMAEYKASGKVATDEVTCATNTTSTHTEALDTTTTSSAVVNTSIKLSDGTTKVVPVTVDLNTLKISKIDCGV